LLEFPKNPRFGGEPVIYFISGRNTAAFSQIIRRLLNQSVAGGYVRSFV